MRSLLDTRRAAILSALVGFVGSAMGQIRFDQTAAVSEDDPIFQPLTSYQAAIEAVYEKGQTARPVFTKWVRVESPAAAQLFPVLRFASVSWSETADPAATTHQVSLAIGLETTLAVDPTTQRVEAKLHGTGNYEEFGKMLVDHAIPLRNEADAKTVWDAFCELHHRHWKDHPARKVSDSEWHLGLASYDQTISTTNTSKIEVTRTHYIKVIVDPTTRRISLWESVVDSSAERTIPKT